ncbi:putative proteasome activator protein [Paratrimastix pyriformis]|uniref:Proteasome activator protein n=1 Tax=Paratrimastix pyriformis TaxID=342808 RepID=A0ABQ8UU96_9EUKA|nr:putative proteasome activator protein [Paratrimastix pyriformis]|eukprot:GAFH01003457.1.p1 GENE.GAFH01003457.1~~GAFH01003457.1.p1  ORF type:complete len:241 (+),score=78.35 GAFH01003457.1:60-782(+)
MRKSTQSTSSTSVVSAGHHRSDRPAIPNPVGVSEAAREESWQKASKIIGDDLPRKIMSLSQQVEDYRTRSTEDVLAGCILPPPEECKATTQYGTNTVVKAILENFGKEVMSTLDMLNILKVWITLSVPPASSGGNFGVAIQAQTIMTISHTEDNVYNFLDAVTKYSATRGSLVSKLAKLPFLQDNREAIRQLDIKAHLDAVVWGLELRNDLSILLDSIQKNLRTLRNPRPVEDYGASTML